MIETRAVPINIEDEIRKSYLEYSLSVIIGRALPDVRDGLKPVHRRILFAMSEGGNDWNRPYRKSARIVGDVIGKYHPHGDTAVYDAIVRMAQDFSLRYPLVDGQGNFGSIDGDSPAAMRYTEVRLTRVAHELLQDLDKDTVDFVGNYDGSLKEPLVLPTRIPNLLINGSSGIAVGMATNIPPHSLDEICDGLLATLNNPDITLAELMTMIPGPDFPTGGFIYGAEGIAEAYRTGRGLIRLRAKVSIERKGGRESLIIRELPYQVNKARLIERVAELVKDKKIEGIADIRDESDREGLRVSILLKKDELAQPILNQLYIHTNMQVTFGINLVAIVHNRPELLGLKDLLHYFLEHRKEVIVRRTRFELKQAEARAHILEGLLIALDWLDAVISMIRAAANPPEAKQQLMGGMFVLKPQAGATLEETRAKYALSEIQAQAILDMRLQRLTGLERQKIINEAEEVRAAIRRFRQILGDEAEVRALIAQELTELKERYGDGRRTEIVPQAQEFTAEDLIADEEMVVTISHRGYIKRTPLTIYRSQRRGGKGRMGMITRENDFVSQLYIASTHSFFLVFTNKGRVFWLKVHEIPIGSPTAQGKAIVNLLQLGENEKLATILPVREFIPGPSLVMATQRGIIKKTDLMNFQRPRGGGIIALSLDAEDELVSAALSEPDQSILLGTRLGKIIRFPSAEVRDMGRAARGVKGMEVDPEDRVVGMEVIHPLGTILTVTERGFGKRTDPAKYPEHHRRGQGVLGLNITKRNGPIMAILQVNEDDEIMLVTDGGKILRSLARGISLIGRVTQGVKLMDLEAEERVVSVAKVAEKSDDSEAEPDLGLS
ncbi:MAG: DNA gyrase subunit A [Syntrophobacterales bacterium]|jgi:DNA gyrase subunit A|nr:DNA gyrase subunit A [Syntrophobacterales bacterium]